MGPDGLAGYSVDSQTQDLLGGADFVLWMWEGQSRMFLVTLPFRIAHLTLKQKEEGLPVVQQVVCLAGGSWSIAKPAFSEGSWRKNRRRSYCRANVKGFRDKLLP